MARHTTRLTIKQILAWADSHHQRTAKWPTVLSGPVREAPDENWHAIGQALRYGARGLPSGGSLPKLLAQFDRRHGAWTLPRLTTKQILEWADAHRRNGDWPTRTSGVVHGAPRESWLGIDFALRQSYRGCRGRSSLPRLLAEHRGVRHYLHPPPLTVEQILRWADSHRRRTGAWPTTKSGPVYQSNGRPAGETWLAIDHALMKGRRGLQQSTLVQLLSKRRNVRNRRNPPPLSVKQVLVWADAHHKRTGKWPTMEMGAIPEAPGETWIAVDAAMKYGRRWRGRRTSLVTLLARRRKKRHPLELPAFRISQILAWADRHQRRSGRWPDKNSGLIPNSGGETWGRVNTALIEGLRGLRGGSSLPRLLEQKRGVRNIQHLPRLTVKQILEWADAYNKREKRWPGNSSGRIPRSGGESWAGVNRALTMGRRGLRGGSSLFRFLNQHRRPERGL